MRTHQEIDERSLALHRLVAEKIARDPTLLARVRRTLDRWRVQVGAESQPYLQEWARVMDAGVGECLRTAVDPSPRGDALRQNSPFGAVLTNEERFAFLKKWNESHAPRRS